MSHGSKAMNGARQNGQEAKIRMTLNGLRTIRVTRTTECYQNE